MELKEGIWQSTYSKAPMINVYNHTKQGHEYCLNSGATTAFTVLDAIYIHGGCMRKSTHRNNKHQVQDSGGWRWLSG